MTAHSTPGASARPTSETRAAASPMICTTGRVTDHPDVGAGQWPTDCSGGSRGAGHRAGNARRGIARPPELARPVGDRPALTATHGSAERPHPLECQVNATKPVLPDASGQAVEDPELTFVTSDSRSQSGRPNGDLDHCQRVSPGRTAVVRGEHRVAEQVFSLRQKNLWASFGSGSLPST